MKEAIQTPYNRCVFRETFRDEQSVRRNGGNPTNVTFANGVGSFNGVNSKINYKLPLNGTYSVRIRCNPTSFVANRYLFDARGSDASGVGRFFISVNTGLVNTSSGTVYVNGIVTKSTIFSNNNEIVIAGIDLIEGSGLNRSLIGLNQSNGDGLLGTIDLVEIYQGTLTASEVANLYNNTWNTEHSPTNVLLDYDSTQGTIKDRTGKNTLTPTDVSIKKIGQSYSADFNGTTSIINTGSDFIGTKAVTVCGWIKRYSKGQGNGGAIFSNDKLLLRDVNNPLDYLYFTSNGAKGVLSANYIPFNKLLFIVVTRKTDGKTTFYIGDKDTAPTLSGSADQDSGTPEAGITNVIIGNNSGATRTFDGNISELKVFENILSIEDITNIWSSTRKKYL